MAPSRYRIRKPFCLSTFVAWSDFQASLPTHTMTWRSGGRRRSKGAELRRGVGSACGQAIYFFSFSRKDAPPLTLLLSGPFLPLPHFAAILPTTTPPCSRSRPSTCTYGPKNYCTLFYYECSPPPFLPWVVSFSSSSFLLCDSASPPPPSPTASTNIRTQKTREECRPCFEND